MDMIYKAPKNFAARNRERKSVFLAGSIEMGKAENWQQEATNTFNLSGWDVLNPRRDDWDSSWSQDFENPQFYQQVSWELTALEHADLIVMYFDPKTKSPISLLELGLFARSGKLKVICPDGFWRKGNVEVVCNFYNIPFYNDWAVFWLDMNL
jgi:Nucleoside 2-deoxyribosyltransferase like